MEELFAKMFNKNGTKCTKIGYTPKKGLQVKYDMFGKPIYNNAPDRRAPPLNTLTTQLLQEVHKNDDFYKLLYQDIKVPSTMSWDQIPTYVEDRAEVNYQTLKPIFYPT